MFSIDILMEFAYTRRSSQRQRYSNTNTHYNHNYTHIHKLIFAMCGGGGGGGGVVFIAYCLLLSTTTSSSSFVHTPTVISFLQDKGLHPVVAVVACCHGLLFTHSLMLADPIKRLADLQRAYDQVDIEKNNENKMQHTHREKTKYTTHTTTDCNIYTGITSNTSRQAFGIHIPHIRI